MFVKLALSFDSLNKSRVESRNLGLWQQRYWEGKKKKDKHDQCFPFRVHYSADPW